MTALFFSFTKRLNSTKRPQANTGKSLDLQIKNESSFLNPTIQVSKDIVSGVFSPDAFNYVFIPYWQRYYYITDWKYLNGIWEASCAVDPLASFRTEIGQTSTYVVRCDSAYDGYITDSFYPATTQVSITKQQISSDIYRTSIPAGCYILGCINYQTSTRVGAVSYYALTDSQMSSVLQYLFSSSIYNTSSITEIGEGLYKSLFDPFQYIVSCMWFPVPASTMGTTQTDIKVGYWSTGVMGIMANNIVREIGFKSNLPIAQHPQISRGEYLNHAPYTRVTAYYAPFGEIPVDTMHMQYGTNNYLYGKMYIDFITGIADCGFSITNGYGDNADPYKYFTMRTAQIGVPIQISQVMSDYVSTLTNGLTAVASGFTGNIAGIFSNLTSAVESAMPKVSSQGANGSLAEIIEPPYLVVEHMRLVNENRTEFGRPLCQTKTINTLSGYIKCGEADHAFPCTRTESEEINRNMIEGFFYE